MRGEEGDVRGVRLQVGHNAGLYSDERRRARILRIVLGLIVLIAVVVGGCGRQPPEELVEEYCTDCHTMAIIEASGKTDQEWGATVSRMIRACYALSQHIGDRFDEASGHQDGEGDEM